jgi:hypothetical protein
MEGLVQSLVVGALLALTELVIKELWQRLRQASAAV